MRRTLCTCPFGHDRSRAKRKEQCDLQNKKKSEGRFYLVAFPPPFWVLSTGFCTVIFQYVAMTALLKTRVWGRGVFC